MSDDQRLRVSREFTGAFEPAPPLLPGQRWVVRFLGEWIGSATTEALAWEIAREWNTRRMDNADA